MSDWDHSCVHGIKLWGSNTVNTWSVASNPAGLSVNKVYHLVVACYGANKLQEYITDGTLVRDISLQGGVTSPWHAIQLTTGNYVVSQNRSLGVVSVVNVGGQVVLSCGQSQTSAVGQMKHPASLAVTSNDDILVADQLNNRILSINGSLNYVQKLNLPVDGRIEHPVGLYLDDSRGRLYVCELAGQQRMLVFDGVTF